MDVKCVAFLLITFITFVCVESEDRCYQIYECCKRLHLRCIEYCGPFVECITIKADQELEITAPPEELPLTTEAITDQPVTYPLNPDWTTQPTIDTAVIGVSTCRLGFKIDGNGRCRRVL